MSYRTARKFTCQLLDMVEQGVIDKDYLIQDLLGWMSEAEVEEFCRASDYIPDETYLEDEEES